MVLLFNLLDKVLTVIDAILIVLGEILYWVGLTLLLGGAVFLSVMLVATITGVLVW